MQKEGKSFWTVMIKRRLLAEAFYLTGDIEKYGTGFICLHNWLKDYPE
jgi:ATP-dependent DNA helicase RecG